MIMIVNNTYLSFEAFTELLKIKIKLDPFYTLGEKFILDNSSYFYIIIQNSFNNNDEIDMMEIVKDIKPTGDECKYIRIVKSIKKIIINWVKQTEIDLKQILTFLNK